MFNKRGQLFLVAALVISALLIGLTAVYTTTQAPKSDLVVYDLSSELNYETAQVIKHTLYSGMTKSETDDLIVDLTSGYVEQNPGNDIIIVYGDESGVTIQEYNWVSDGSLSLDFGGVSSELRQNRLQVVNKTLRPSITTDQGTKSTVTLNITSSLSQTFTLTPGQTFISIIKREFLDQKYVSTGGTTSALNG